jgi:hypothetical protein
MRRRSMVNFRAKTLFACSAKVVSSVRDRCSGIPAAGRAVAPRKAHPRHEMGPGTFFISHGARRRPGWGEQSAD